MPSHAICHAMLVLNLICISSHLISSHLILSPCRLGVYVCRYVCIKHYSLGNQPRFCLLPRPFPYHTHTHTHTPARLFCSLLFFLSLSSQAEQSSNPRCI
ncbi:hypothetical protein F5Y14DRAFT_191512 [Nemania sp. NC0429]|nr:hypothetical protein F5Y14DRAFT_191512 [Nemania sp. NC0429]